MDTIYFLQKSIRRWLLFFMIALLLSGITAFAVETELDWVLSWWPERHSSFFDWLQKSFYAIRDTNHKYPYVSYGYDWLAYAHIVIAIAFIGPLKNPVKNIWVVQFAGIACLLIIPFAFIAGAIRQIPVFWRLIDCAFGVIGLIPVSIIYQKTLILQKLEMGSGHK